MKKVLVILFVIQNFLMFSQTFDASGKKQGYWKKTDERTGKLIYEGEFKDNKPIGKFKYYYPNDTTTRAVMIFKNDGKISYAKLFHQNGKRAAEGKYINKETKDSIWTYYDESGTLLSSDTYSVGKKNGKSCVYLVDGTLSEEKFYKNDLQDGVCKQYFDGKTVKSQSNYVNGKQEGRTTYYYPNGTEIATGVYKNGVKNGIWIYKEENGKLKERELYRNGKLASKKEMEEFLSKNKQQQATGNKQTTTNDKKPETQKQQGTKK